MAIHIFILIVSVSFGHIFVKGVNGEVGVDLTLDERMACFGACDIRLARGRGVCCADENVLSEPVCLSCGITTEFGEGVDTFNRSEPNDVRTTRCKKRPESVMEGDKDTNMRLSPKETFKLNHATRSQYFEITGFVLATLTVNFTCLCYIVSVARRRKNKEAIRDTPCEEETSISPIASDPSPTPSSVESFQSNSKNLHVVSAENGDRSSGSNIPECKTPHGQGFLEPSAQTEQPANSMPEISENVSNQQLLDEIQERKERMNCKVCLNARMCVVFLPCNHMLACGNCSVLMDRCAVCRTLIKGTFVVHTQF